MQKDKPLTEAEKSLRRRLEAQITQDFLDNYFIDNTDDDAIDDPDFFDKLYPVSALKKDRR